MSNQEIQVVTGAFGYLGKYITRILLDRGIRVKTLTGHPNRSHSFGESVQAVPFHFDDPGQLVSDLEGVTTVYNTYWVRFNHGRVSYGQAVANTQNLIRAAKDAGVKRFVHISIANPSEDSPFPYFSGKAIMERTLIESGLSYAILRPTVLFGKEDILINNIAWMLRRLPFFGVFGAGDYRIQPVYVGDVAALAVDLAGLGDSVVCDATGPETYTFEDLVRLIRARVQSRSFIVHVPPLFALLVGYIFGPLLRDVLITRDEVGGLMDGLLVSELPPTCPTRFSEWLLEHADRLGRAYASELERHYR